MQAEEYLTKVQENLENQIESKRSGEDWDVPMKAYVEHHHDQTVQVESHPGEQREHPWTSSITIIHCDHYLVNYPAVLMLIILQC